MCGRFKVVARRKAHTNCSHGIFRRTLACANEGMDKENPYNEDDELNKEDENENIENWQNADGRTEASS